ncbi:MAG: iron-sulfur cluster assembly accessory protein, partial [Cyanobacteria bacterium J06600_6]
INVSSSGFLMVNITPTAVAEIERQKLNQQTPDIFLRLAVKSGGCLDFFYDLTFESSAFVDDLAAAASDRLLEVNGINLIVDLQSWEYIQNLELDYAEDLMGGGFRFHNPQHQKTCGCGISFTPPAT